MLALLGVGLVLGRCGLVALLLLLLLLLLSDHERLQLLLEGAQLFVALPLDLAGARPRALQLLLSRGLVLELLGARLGRVGRPLQGGVLARDEGSQVGLGGAVLPGCGGLARRLGLVLVRRGVAVLQGRLGLAQLPRQGMQPPLRPLFLLTICSRGHLRIVPLGLLAHQRPVELEALGQLLLERRAGRPRRSSLCAEVLESA